MARGARRGNIYAGQVDRSWMKFARCKLCGQKVCFNNFADHKPRPEYYRVKGVFLCIRCKMNDSFPLELYLFVKELAAKKCKTGEAGCTCRSCRARVLCQKS